MPVSRPMGSWSRRSPTIDAAYGLATSVTDAAQLCWSAMQGLVALQPKFAHLDALRGGTGIDIDIEERASRFNVMLVKGMLATPP